MNTNKHYTAKRTESSSAFGSRNDCSVLYSVKCVCGGGGLFGTYPVQVDELVTLWDWHGECKRAQASK